MNLFFDFTGAGGAGYPPASSLWAKCSPRPSPPTAGAAPGPLALVVGPAMQIDAIIAR